MNTDKELLVECLQNIGVTIGVLAGVEEHMIEQPRESKEILHELNQELQEYLEKYGVDVEETIAEARKDGGQDDN